MSLSATVIASILTMVVATNVVAATLVLKWGSLSSSIHAGAYATAVVTTTSKARCTIVVNLKTTVSKSTGLIAKTAPTNGRLSWRWKTGTNTSAGSWRVTVTCKLGTKTLSVWRTMTILRRAS